MKIGNDLGRSFVLGEHIRRGLVVQRQDVQPRFKIRLKCSKFLPRSTQTKQAIALYDIPYTRSSSKR